MKQLLIIILTLFAVSFSKSQQIPNNNPLPLTALIDEKNGRLPITPYPVIYSDSTPIKYRYIIRIEATPQQWGRAMYISDSIMLHWGKERGGTEIEKALNMYSAVMDFLRTAAKVDSVKLTGGKL